MSPGLGMTAPARLFRIELLLLVGCVLGSSCGTESRFEGSWSKERVGTIQIFADGRVTGEFLALIGKQEQKSEAAVGGVLPGRYAYSGDLGPFTVSMGERSFGVAKEHVSATPAFMEPLEVHRTGDTTSTIIGYYATQRTDASWRARNPGLVEVFVPGKDERTGAGAEIILFNLYLKRDHIELEPVHWFSDCAGSYSRAGKSGASARK